MTPTYRTVQLIDHRRTGDDVRVARKRAGISLREFARRLGVSASFVCDLEHGDRNWTEGRFAKAMRVLAQRNNAGESLSD